MSSINTKTNVRDMKKVEFHKHEYNKLIEEVKKTYDSLAEFYDYFYPPLDFKASAFIQTLHNFLQEYKVKKLLDCACGTGREIIPLARTGEYERLVGSDLSIKMLEKAKQKSKGLPIQWIHSDWIELHQRITERDFDAILCLGNPLAHVPPWSYDMVFSQIYHLLRSGGILLLNRRNCEAELGLQNFKYNRPRHTISLPLPKISFMGTHQRNNTDSCTYFSYHHYNSNERIQLLHCLEVNRDGKYNDRIFRFHCYNEMGASISASLSRCGFMMIKEFDFGEDDLHTYAEEIYVRAIKDGES